MGLAKKAEMNLFSFSKPVNLIDKYDSKILQDIYWKFPLWSRIRKHRWVEFLESNHGSGDVIKAIVADLEFTRFDSEETGPLESINIEDAFDLYEKCLRCWNDQFYNGDTGIDATNFNGLNSILQPKCTIFAEDSILLGISDTLKKMYPHGINTCNEKLPTAIYCDAATRELIREEAKNNGIELSGTTAYMGNGVHCFVYLVQTSIGPLPLIIDPFYRSNDHCGARMYRIFILNERKINWSFVPPNRTETADPKIFEIETEDENERKFKVIMFGALEVTGVDASHCGIDIEDRATPVSFVGV